MDFILQFFSNYPIAASVLMIIGVLRVINKPLFTFLHTYVDATPSPSDNQVLEGVEQSKIYQWISYALDWFGSVKLPTKPKS